MTELLNREIKGVTAKLVWSVLAGYTTILISVLGIYFTSKHNFDKLTEQIRAQSVTDEQKSEWIRKEVRQLEIKQSALENKVNLQQIEIEKIKTQLNIK